MGMAVKGFRLLFLTLGAAGLASGGRGDPQGPAGVRKAFAHPDALRRGGIYKPFFDFPWKVMNEPFLAGMELYTFWGFIEPEEGKFDWYGRSSRGDHSNLDQRLAELDGSHRAIIRLGGGTAHPDNPCPKWVLDRVPAVNEEGKRYPCYWHPFYLEKFRNAILAYGKRYDGHPKVERVHIQVGLWGEVLLNSEEWKKHGHTPEVWIDTVKKHIDFHIEAFRKTPLEISLSGALPRSASLSTIDEIVTYCAARNVGVGFRGMGPDYPGDPAFWNWGPDGYYHHIFERAYGKVPLHAETGWHGPKPPQGGPPFRDPDFVWQEVYAQLHYHVNYSNMRADYSRRELVPAFEFLKEHLGVTLDRTLDVWIALKPKRLHGNYEFWLYQAERPGKTLSGRGGDPVRDFIGTNQAKGQNVIALGVDPAFVTDQTGRFNIEVTYLDEGRDAWSLEYQARSGGWHRAGEVRKTGTGAWSKHRFQVQDASFGRGRRGEDLRLDCMGDGDDAFHFVRVFRIDPRKVGSRP